MKNAYAGYLYNSIMVCVYYVGFNAYRQCPNERGISLPKIIDKWEKCCFETVEDVECLFRNVVVKTESNLVVYGLFHDENVYKKILNYPCNPKTQVATDEYLFVSEGCQLWKSQFDNNWSLIVFDDGQKSVLGDKEIRKMCYMTGKTEMMILLSDGSVWRLDRDNKLSVVFSPVLDKAVDISCGFEHVLVLTESGCVMSCGNGSHGQLGHGDLDSLVEPLQVLALGGLKIVKIDAGGWHSSAVTDSGDLYLWGWNNFGQLTEIKEIGSNGEVEKFDMTALPMVADIDPNRDQTVVDVACGVRHTVILTDSNELFATGWNEYGQLGLDSRGVKKTKEFVKIASPTGSGRIKLKCGPWSTLIYEKNLRSGTTNNIRSS